MNIPFDIFVYKISPWLIEFNRREMMDRYEIAHTIYSVHMRDICEDIRANTPVYILNILTSNTFIQMPIALPNCDPNLFRTDLRIPQSHISSFYRRSLSLPHILHRLIA